MSVRDEAVATVRDLARSRLTDSAVAVCMGAIGVSKDDAVLECLLARLMLELRALPEATRAATRAVELDPACIPAHFVLGRALDRSGAARDQAMLLWADLAELLPDSAPIRVQLGETLRAAGLEDEALAAWNRALKLEPSCARAMYLLALAALEREGIGTALPGLRKAAELDPGQDRLFFALAGFDVAGALPASVDEVAADRESRLAAAGTYALMESYFPAAELVRLLLTERSDDADALALAAFCYLKQEALSESIACALRALEVRPRTPGAVYVLGAAFARRPSLAAHAVQVFRALAKSVPDHPMPRVLLGEALLGLQAYDEAGGSLRAALELDPGSVRARFGLALVLLTQGHYADATWQVHLAAESDLERRGLFWALFDEYLATATPERSPEGGEA